MGGFYLATTDVTKNLPAEDTDFHLTVSKIITRNCGPMWKPRKMYLAAKVGLRHEGREQILRRKTTFKVTDIQEYKNTKDVEEYYKKKISDLTEEDYCDCGEPLCSAKKHSYIYPNFYNDGAHWNGIQGLAKEERLHIHEVTVELVNPEQ